MARQWWTQLVDTQWRHFVKLSISKDVDTSTCTLIISNIEHIKSRKIKVMGYHLFVNDDEQKSNCKCNNWKIIKSSVCVKSA